MGPVCQHCGRATTEEEGTVCDDCYSHYTVAMLNDMDQ
jgi:NMD protein affecting ribosome stability and mRNA decay